MSLLRLPGFVVILAAVALGCSATEGTTGSGGKGPARATASDLASEKALQHFIDGSVHETRGDYAQAIIEYQDALRYDPNHAVYYALSKCYYRLNKQTLAIEAGREAVRLSPDKPEYHRNLGDAYAASYQIDSAAAHYEEVVRLDSTDIQSWFALANLYSGRKPLRALEVYDGLLERFGEEWEVLLQVADLHSAMGQPDKAAQALERMLLVDPGNIGLMHNLAQTYVRAGDYPNALRVYGDLRERDPEDLDYLGELATVYLLTKDYKKAAELFDVVLSRDSVSVEAKLQIGEAYFSQIQSDSTLIPFAKDMFSQIRDKHPEDWRAYWFLGAIGGLSNDDSAAVTNFRKVTELAPWNADAWGYLATIYLQNEDYDEVVSILEHARTQVTDNYQINLYLGIAYTQLHRTADAIYVLEEACRLEPRDLRATSQLGLIYDQEKRYAQLDSLYSAALEVDSTNHLILNNYGYSLAERGVELEEALRMSQKAVSAQPDNPSYLDTIGWVHFRLGQYAEAEKYIKEAIAKGDPNSVLHEHLGDVYYMIDDTDRAMEQWKIALDLDRDNELLREKIARGGL